MDELPGKRNLTQIAPVVVASLLPALVYVTVVRVSRFVSDLDVAAVAWVALIVAAALVWMGIDEYLAEREATVAAMKQFGQTFVQEFQRPLLQTDRSERPIHSQLRASPDRRRLDILLAPAAGRRYPNLSDHRTNVAYDVTRVLELLHDRRFVCGSFYSQGSWVVVPFEFRVSAKAGHS
jgi:hypothetical protein